MLPFLLSFLRKMPTSICSHSHSYSCSVILSIISTTSLLHIFLSLTWLDIICIPLINLLFWSAIYNFISSTFRFLFFPKAAELTSATQICFHTNMAELNYILLHCAVYKYLLFTEIEVSGNMSNWATEAPMTCTPIV